jgi:hypothetical protein
MDKEIQHRRKIGELEAELNNLKVKEVALHSNKSSKPTTSSNNFIQAFYSIQALQVKIQESGSRELYK